MDDPNHPPVDLRDWLAGQFIAGAAASYNAERDSQDFGFQLANGEIPARDPWIVRWFAERAYAIADACLAERDNTSQL